MLTALLLSFGVIFVAELGDKSQLMAMTYAIRYRWWVVLLGITVATTAVHAVSVLLGHHLGLSIPTDLISIVGGVAMVVFGLWTIRGDELDESESAAAGRVGASVLLAVMSSFFLAELGDKTMLATITLSTDHDAVGVWIGSTVGMVAADALAIGVGAVLGRRLPERIISLGAAVLFFGFGAWLIAEGILAANSAMVTVIALSATAVVGAVGTTYVVAVRRARAARSPAFGHADEVVTDRR
ncbi:TMEM165/GDT1 family protein [Williamsia sp. CHRR-6]|uniref:TMEM165/GDT1 family protein n=1 Tax=Williamsia sp. CHRR-6 TaxID=2835871 RepID=UPI001BD9A79B|nr:TMEM165/GDT1 family protein [Williamsia sp. CHRR-6]MBT0567644.1 TMEM165/GDT1 family protein [Williamsia sp. CHRR-6]